MYSDITFSNSTIAAVKEQVSSKLDGETVILHIKTGSYYGLNEVGTQIWNMIQEPQTLVSIRDAILSQYDVEQQQLENDIRALVNELRQKGLVEISYEAAV